MSIELHCPHCAKHIRAPDDAGGKRGKCPACGGSLYIPMPVSDDDLIPLAPLDEDAERRAEELRRESITYAASVDKDAARAGTEGRRDEGTKGLGPPQSEMPGEVVDYGGLVNRFIVAMHESKLDEAERVAARLKKAGVRAHDYVDGLFLDQMPPNIKGVPPQLVKSFLKALLGRLGE